MAGLNKVILIGHLGKDPDLFTFDDGTKKISFSLATTESYRDRNTGNWVDTVEWHNVVGYRYLAERNLAKGDMVYVEGKIKTRKYNDRDGNEKYITEILSEKINLLAHPKGTFGNQEYGNNPSVADSNQSNTSNLSPEIPQQPEDDLPF